jgi:uncharacterized protein YutE (UPF0331/DUF86 family)
MTERAILENKISSVEKYLTIVKKYIGVTAEELKADFEKRGAVERYLYLLIQSTIDLGEEYIALRGFRKPTTLSDVFYVLQEQDIITPVLAEKLVKLVGFRNILSHEYEVINYEIVEKILRSEVVCLENFKEIIKNS